MDKNKYLWVVWVALSVIVLGGGGFFAWQKLHPKTEIHNSKYGAEASTSDSASLKQSNTSALNVGGSSSANDLGQLGSGGGQNPLGSTNNSNAAGGANSGSSNSSSGLPDPSTFAQYDKYKDNTSALMADIQKGTGTELAQGKKAAVYYRGFLTNGTVFDETRNGSDGKPQPFVFTEGQHQVITGWEQGLAGMKVGGVRLLIVPPSVGYGANAQGSIPANSVLIFEVQLLEVQ
jgi:FKBP-type peptidyl-prolyl cis-trans isomerase FkpA